MRKTSVPTRLPTTLLGFTCAACLLSVGLGLGAHAILASSVIGPDAFGYAAVPIPGNLRDISSSGQFIALDDDEISDAIEIGFDFSFYGSVMRDVYISSNGLITFAETNNDGCCSGDPIPSTRDPDNLVAGFWEDFSPQGRLGVEPGNIRVELLKESPQTDDLELVIGFYDVPHFSSGPRVSFEMILHESGGIELQYGEAPGDGLPRETSVGIENVDGTVGLEIAHGDVSFSNQGFMITDLVFSDMSLSKADIDFAERSQKSSKSEKSTKSEKSEKSSKDNKLDGYKIEGEFSLSGHGHDYIDPVGESVVIGVGSSALRIPPGSFAMNGDLTKAEFDGSVGETEVNAEIEEISDEGEFKFKFDVTGVELTDSSIPLTVYLLIGPDLGSVAAPLQGKLELLEDD